MLKTKTLFLLASICASAGLGSVAARADSVSISVDSATAFASSSSISFGGSVTGVENTSAAVSLINGVNYVVTLSDQWTGTGAANTYFLIFSSNDHSVFKILWAVSSTGASGSQSQSVSFIYNGATGVNNGNLSLRGTFHSLQVIGGGSGSATATLASVPGPVAGAGAPALLGLAGLAGWRRRRRAA